MAKANQVPAENPNENCLEGMRCPKCGHFGPFKILATKSGMVEVSDDGTDDLQGDTDWDDDSACECCECGHLGTVREFKGEPEPGFDQYQKIVAESYASGDHACHGPDDAKDCGDTLLTFLMSELSEREDCDSFECAVNRLDSAIRQLTEVRSAFETKLLT